MLVSRFNLSHSFNYTPTVPEIIDPVFAKTSPKRSFCMTENERIGLIFVKTGSINSGTGLFDKKPFKQRSILSVYGPSVRIRINLSARYRIRTLLPSPQTEHIGFLPQFLHFPLV